MKIKNKHKNTKIKTTIKHIKIKIKSIQISYPPF
jgi:hypothetical protein